jgi:signal transduction histidine kinase
LEAGSTSALGPGTFDVRLGIRYRLLVPLALLLLGVVGASLWSARVAARRAEERVAEHVGNVAQTLGNGKYSLTQPILDQMKGLSGAEFLVIQPDGSRMTTFPVSQVELPPEQTLQDPGRHGLGPPVRANGKDYRCRRLVLKGTHPNAGAVVYIFYPEALLEEAIADAERPSFLALFFGLVAIVLTFAIGQRLVGRIRALERRTRQIAAGDFSPMPLPRTNDELRDLTASVNEMAERLDRLHRAVEQAERVRLTSQLSAGLAHQLRNGVTGAKLALEVYMAGRPNGDGEALQVTLRQLETMEANLRRFIDLGRTSEGKRDTCSLSAILSEAVELHRPRCKHAGIELRWEPPARDVRTVADAGQLGDLFGNLIGNAIDAVGVGGEVAITLGQNGSTASVEICDTGPGPSADVAGRLFEPFVTGKPEGIGLGLAVARHAAEAHGGRVSWRRENRRTVFHVELPIRSGVAETVVR